MAGDVGVAGPPDVHHSGVEGGRNGQLAVGHGTEHNVQVLLSVLETLATLFTYLSEHCSSLNDMNIFQTKSMASLVPAVTPNNVVDEHPDAVADGTPPVQEGGHEVQANLQAEAVSGELSSLQKSPPILNSGSAVQDTILLNSNFLNRLRLVEMFDLRCTLRTQDTGGSC